MTFAKLIVSTLLLSAAALAHALDVNPYSAEALAQAQKADMPVTLHFRAWCPTCRAQDKVLESLKTEQGLALTVLSVNYDTEKESPSCPVNPALLTGTTPRATPPRDFAERERHRPRTKD